MTNGNILNQPLLNILLSMSEKMKEEIQFSQLRKYQLNEVWFTGHATRSELTPKPYLTKPHSEPAVILFMANQILIFGKKESLKELHRDVFKLQAQIL